MWELDPRFHTPGWAEKRLKELEREKEMKDKDKQSEDFEHDQTIVKLRVFGEDIDISVAHARAIADTHIQRGPGGRELSLAITNLQQARMWVEEALKEIEGKA